MQVKNEIFDILRTNYTLRKVISDKVKSKDDEEKEIGTRIVNVERWAQRKRVPSWYKDSFISIIENELQLSKDKIVC